MHIPDLQKKPFIIALFVVSSVTAGCGISLGSGSIDDPLPSGTIVAQGDFSGQNSQTVSGVVSIWQQTSGSTCSFVLRVQSLAAPTGMSLSVVPLVNGAPSVSPTYYALRGSTGNQNYTFTGATCGATWAQVSIINTSETDTSKNTVGTATLTRL